MVFLQFHQIVFAHSILDKFISRVSSLHIEVWDDDLTDKDGLVCLQLIYDFQLFLGGLDGGVDLLLSHAGLSLDLVRDLF